MGILMPEVAEVRIIADNISTLLQSLLLEIKLVNQVFAKRTSGLDLVPLPAKVHGVHTRGKFCYILLEDGSAIGLGFGMDGNIRIEPGADMDDGERSKYMRHSHIFFRTAGKNFYYNSARRFGSVNYLSAQELADKLAELGPCILGMPQVVMPDLVARWRKRSGSNICQTLMNQSLVAGIGNYIKSEILYMCRVDPMSTVDQLDDEKLYSLYQAARQVAAAAYRVGGYGTYTSLDGEKTEFRQELCVYDRSHDSLGNPVQRLETPDGRTTHWVPALQRIKKKVIVKLK